MDTNEDRVYNDEFRVNAGLLISSLDFKNTIIKLFEHGILTSDDIAYISKWATSRFRNLILIAYLDRWKGKYYTEFLTLLTKQGLHYVVKKMEKNVAKSQKTSKIVTEISNKKKEELVEQGLKDVLQRMGKNAATLEYSEIESQRKKRRAISSEDESSSCNEEIDEIDEAARRLIALRNNPMG